MKSHGGNASGISLEFSPYVYPEFTKYSYPLKILLFPDKSCKIRFDRDSEKTFSKQGKTSLTSYLKTVSLDIDFNTGTLSHGKNIWKLDSEGTKILNKVVSLTYDKAFEMLAPLQLSPLQEVAKYFEDNDWTIKKYSNTVQVPVEELDENDLVKYMKLSKSYKLKFSIRADNETIGSFFMDFR